MLFSSSNNPVESVPGPVRSTLPPLSSLLRVDVDAHLVVPSLPILPNHPTMYKQHHLFGLPIVCGRGIKQSCRCRWDAHAQANPGAAALQGVGAALTTLSNSAAA